jgi:hypothetical protein
MRRVCSQWASLARILNGSHDVQPPWKPIPQSWLYAPSSQHHVASHHSMLWVWLIDSSPDLVQWFATVGFWTEWRGWTSIQNRKTKTNNFFNYSTDPLTAYSAARVNLIAIDFSFSRMNEYAWSVATCIEYWEHHGVEAEFQVRLYNSATQSHVMQHVVQLNYSASL